ncbi:CmcI family methyltransferase [Plastoroseomonas hellenica]|nr:CmcI family methyltransferase [Plastoroseomonas hellenica]
MGGLDGRVVAPATRRRLMTSGRCAAAMADSHFGATALPPDVIRTLQQGIMNWSYRGRPTWKSPIDLALYTDLLWELRPRTILEFGSNRGGSALWFADMMTTYGVTDGRVFSLDIHPVDDLEDPRIVFGHCDVARPQDALSIADLRNLPKPLLVIDDASHVMEHVLSVLRFVDKALVAGDYLIVEDGILTHLGSDEHYRGGPLAALQIFLAESGMRYAVDRARCDAFGRNVTWNPEGYLRCIRD